MKTCKKCYSVYWTGSRYSTNVCEDCYLRDRKTKRGKYPSYLTKEQAKKYEEKLEKLCKERQKNEAKKKTNKTAN